MADPRDGEPAGDDELLSRLGAAFAVEPVAPPAEGLAALRHAVAERRVGGTRGGPARARVRRPWWRQPLPVGGLVFGLVVGGTGTALAAGAPLPRPVRSLAHDIGLPVDSPQLDDVRRANNKLRDDLSTPTSSPSTGRDAAELARKLASLDADERSKVAAESEQLLGEAHGDQQGQSGDAGQSGSTGGGGSNGGSGSGGSGSGGSGSGGSGSGGSGSGGSGSGGSGSGGGGGGGDSSGGRSGDGGRSSGTSTPTRSNTPTTAGDGHHGSGGGGTGGGADDAGGGHSGSDRSGGGGGG